MATWWARGTSRTLFTQYDCYRYLLDKCRHLVKISWSGGIVDKDGLYKQEEAALESQETFIFKKEHENI